MLIHYGTVLVAETVATCQSFISYLPNNQQYGVFTYRLCFVIAPGENEA